MPCLVIEMPGGGKAIVKVAPQRKKRCPFCPNGWVSRLCDFKLDETHTCDAGMCSRCAYAIAPEVDYCPKHRDEHKRQRSQARLF